jgi:PPP family 3-phenylpropionic acid transporter
MKDKYNPIIYRLLYYAIFTGDALFSPFYYQYYRSVGLSDAQSGVLLAIVPFSLFLGGLFFSHFATTFKKSLRVMRILSVLEVFSFVAFGFCTTYWPLLVLTVIASFFNSAYFTIQDGTCTIAMKKAGKGYESIRIFGSIAYAVALIGGFFIVGIIPYSVLYTIAAFFFLCGFVLTFLIVPVDDEIPDRTVASEASSAAVPEEKKGLFSNKQFILFLIYNTLFFASVNSLGTLLTVYLEKGLGLQDNEYSLWYGLRVVAEIASLLAFPFVFRKLKSHKKSLMISGSLFILSGLLAIVIPEKNALVSSAFLIRGLANGLSLVSGVLLLHSIVGDRLVTRALVISGALCNFLTGLGNLLFDYMSRATGYPLVFVALSVISVVGFVLLFFIKEPVEEVDEKAAPQKA